jgi:3'-phosphoadenosine 5'-phosphosulfate sulfotransferase (PAPS reductase)/FAD synthetase
MNIDEILSNCPKNKTIVDNLIRGYHIINNPKYENIMVSISGGADSDVMMDICSKLHDNDSNIIYVYFDTGLEYDATKKHIEYLENKYNTNIEIFKPKKTIPFTCNHYGQPFISKYVSEMMSRLQRHNFKWEDEPFDVLYERYPKCKGALQWWTNSQISDMFNIRRNKGLKEFIISNPPEFKISNLCCKYAKKNIARDVIKSHKCDLNVIGVRKYENGIRSAAYKNCFDEKLGECDVYRPLFWYTNQDKEEYEKFYNIKHSNCYSEYGLLRTGCAGCPFGRDFEVELNVIETFEPKLYKAVNNIFGDSYEYTRKYREFKERM